MSDRINVMIGPRACRSRLGNDLWAWVLGDGWRVTQIIGEPWHVTGWVGVVGHATWITGRDHKAVPVMIVTGGGSVAVARRLAYQSLP